MVLKQKRPPWPFRQKGKENKMYEITGAYNRRYNNFANAKKDWQAGKDFKIVGGSYMNKAEYNPLDSILFYINGKLEFMEVGYF